MMRNTFVRRHIELHDTSARYVLYRTIIKLITFALTSCAVSRTEHKLQRIDAIRVFMAIFLESTGCETTDDDGYRRGP